MLSGDVKRQLIEILVEMVERHQKARAAVTDEVGCFLELCLSIVSNFVLKAETPFLRYRTYFALTKRYLRSLTCLIYIKKFE